MPKKKKMGRPQKKQSERLVNFTIPLPPEAIAYLGEKAQGIQAAGTAAYARMLVMEGIRREQALEAGAFKAPRPQVLTDVKK